MIPLIVLIPAVVALVMLFFRPASFVLLRVYLPCLMLVPLYLHFGIGGLSVDPSSFVVGILAVFGLTANFRTLRPSLLDLLVALYLLSIYMADAHHALVDPAHQQSFRTALYATLGAVFGVACPYIVGRTLIEQTGSRRKVVQSFTFWLVVVAAVSLWEYRMTSNLFQSAEELIAHVSSGWIRQMRWGLARIAGPYGHAITAGMIFTMGILFQLWLLGTRPRESRLHAKSLRFSLRMLNAFPGRAVVLKQPRTDLRKHLFVTAGIALGLFMTQSRGPWIGCGFGLIVASIGFFRNRRRAAIIAISVLAIAAAVTSVALNRYTDAPANTRDVDQRNAVYRRQLLDTYTPLIHQGGFWGWGTPEPDAYGNYSYAKNQASIDNQYLLVAMAQGYFGVALWVSMVVYVIVRLTLHCISLRRREDFTFAFCLLGVVVATAFSLTTVFLGQPMIQIVFLIFGWAESIPKRQKIALPEKTQPYVFERVFL